MSIDANEIARVLLFRGGFNTSTVLGGTMLLGLAAGVIGSFALLRKRSLMADALSHATLPGIGLAFLVAGGASGRSLPVLLAGGAVTGVVGVLCVLGLLRSTRLREDAAIGAVLSVFFGAGVVLLSYIQANRASHAGGLSHFIYGQTAAMRTGDVVLMGSIALVAIAGAMLLLKELTIVCFNDAFARVNGWPVGAIDLAMMGLVVLVTVAGLQAVGLIMVVALLIIPPVAARFWTDRLSLFVVLSGAIGAVSAYLGSAASALLPDTPAGALIVLTSGAVFALSMLVAPKRGVLASVARDWSLRLRIAGDHVLEAAYETGHAGLDRAELDAMWRLRGTPGWARAGVRWWLRRTGAITADGGGVALTPDGLARGRRVRRNHALWEQYLIGYADIAPSHVDWSVDRVEHVLDEPMIERLERALSARGIDVTEPAGAGGTP